MLKVMVIFAVLLPLTSFAGERQPPPGDRSTGTYTNNNERDKSDTPSAAVYSPSCGQRTKGCLKPGTYYLDSPQYSGTLMVTIYAPLKKSK